MRWHINRTLAWILRGVYWPEKRSSDVCLQFRQHFIHTAQIHFINILNCVWLAQKTKLIIWMSKGFPFYVSSTFLNETTPIRENSIQTVVFVAYIYTKGFISKIYFCELWFTANWLLAFYIQKCYIIAFTIQESKSQKWILKEAGCLECCIQIHEKFSGRKSVVERWATWK